MARVIDATYVAQRNKRHVAGDVQKDGTELIWQLAVVDVEEQEVDVLLGRESNNVLRRIPGRERGDAHGHPACLQCRALLVERRCRCGKVHLVVGPDQADGDHLPVGLRPDEGRSKREQPRRAGVGARQREHGTVVRAGGSRRVHRSGAQFEGRVLGEDRAFQPLQSRTRLEPELVCEGPARLLIRVECFGLPISAVQGKHQLAACSLAQGPLPHDRLELGNELGMAPKGEVGLDPLLERGEPQLLEAQHGASRKCLETQIGERRTSPELERRRNAPAASSARPTESARRPRSASSSNRCRSSSPGRTRATYPGARVSIASRDSRAFRSCET